MLYIESFLNIKTLHIAQLSQKGGISMDIAIIKKRDGRLVSFDRAKIQNAMEKAALAVDADADLRPFGLIVDHVLRHVEIQYGEATPDVEGVQDLVERTLMEHGHYEVGKAYILYRAEQAKRRDLPTEPAPAQTSLSMVSADGTQQVVSEQHIRDIFVEYAQGLESIDVDLLVRRALNELHDGMKSADLDTAVTFASRAYIELDPEYSLLAARLGMRSLYHEVFGRVERRHVPAAYRKAFKDNISAMVRDGRLDSRMLEFDFEAVAAALKPERDNLFEYLGFQTLYDRYFLREEGGERKLETPQAFWMRVAMGLSMQEKHREAKAIEFYEVMSTLHYVPSTPTLFMAGTTRPQLSSCYLNTVEDDLSHIFKVYGDNAQLSKYSGGIGTDWTNIRATGSLIKATNVNSQGVVPFLRIANDVTVAINRSGKRRGATCAYLETWHMDIEDFLDLRRNTGDERRRTHDMNTANWIPDLFMKRVNDGGQWTLFSPEETHELHHIYGSEFEKKYIEYEQKADRGEVKLFKRMPAKELWRKMISMLFETGHPWVTFKDPCNVRSPQDHVGVIHNSNLCTEITLNNSEGETAVCNLGSVNLARHMVGVKLDEEKIARTVATAMRMLDNVIDLNYYPTKETKVSNMRHRPVGLGIMGFQDALYLADMDFDSDETVRFADYSMELISYHAILNSALLAKERGAYETFEGSKWDRGIFPVDTLNLLEQERGMPIGVMRTSRLDWTPVRAAVRDHGMRNSNTMAIAPTATISNISGCYPCIEPIYKNLYVKANMSGDFTVVNKYLVEDLKKLGLWNQTVLEEIKQHDGSIGDVSVIPPRLRSKYKEVFDIDTEWLIKAAAYRGKWIDQSQSLNIFFKGTSGRRLAEMYVLAWHMGLKTTYYLRTTAASGVEKSTVDLQAAAAPAAAATMNTAAAIPVAPVAVTPAPATTTVQSVLPTSPVPAQAFASSAPSISETLAAMAPVTAEPSPSLIASAPVVANAVVSLEPEAPVSSPAATAVAIQESTSTPKLCLIDDPDCEACQ
jgi:ribonucleoside-diphosphate reductase alpha chain